MIVLNYTEMRLYCRLQICTHNPWFLASGFAGEVVSNESAVGENVSFVFRSLSLSQEVPHMLYIPKFTRLRAVSRRQHGSCFIITKAVTGAILAFLSLGSGDIWFNCSYT